MFTNVNRPSAVDVLRPFVTGDMFYADSTTTLAKLPIGSETQVLNVATAIPTWTSTISLTGLTVKDNTFNIVGNVDDTKRLKFEVDAQSTLTRLTIDTGAQTVDRTLSVPVLTGNATLMTLEETQTVTGAKTFSNAAGVVVSATTGTTLTVSSTTDATSSTAGSVALAGGLAVAKGQYVGTFLNVGTDVTVASSVKIGDLSGYGIVSLNNDISSAAGVCGIYGGGAGDDALYVNAPTGASVQCRINNTQVMAFEATLVTVAAGATLSVASTTDSTSKDTGSIVTEGGLGVEKAIYAGASINATTGLFSGDYSASAGMTFKAADASAASIAFRTATNSATRWELIKTGTTHTLNWSAFDSSGTLIDTPISCLNAANGALTFARPTTISDVLKVSGATNLPTACGGALFIAGNQSGSVSGSIYIGDGTGWSFKIRSRTGSADTDRITITDAGVVTLTSTSASSITLSGGILFDGATTKTIKYTNGTANASVATTLGSVGPTGSTAGDPQGWLRVNIGGTDRYIPYW